MGVAVMWQVEGAAEARRHVPQQDQCLPGSLQQHSQTVKTCLPVFGEFLARVPVRLSSAGAVPCSLQQHIRPDKVVKPPQAGPDHLGSLQQHGQAVSTYLTRCIGQISRSQARAADADGSKPSWQQPACKGNEYVGWHMGWPLSRLPAAAYLHVSLDGHCKCWDTQIQAACSSVLACSLDGCCMCWDTQMQAACSSVVAHFP